MGALELAVQSTKQRNDETPERARAARLQRTVLRVLGALVLALAGCEDGRTRADSGTIDQDAGGGQGDAGDAPPDAGGEPSPGRFPDVPLVNVGHESWNIVTFETFNIVVNDTGSLTEAFFVVRNTDPVLNLCSVTGQIGLFDAAGNGLGTIWMSYDSRVMQIFDFAVTCIPPGEIALGYGNASGALRLDDVAEIRYVFSGDGYEDAVPYGVVNNENMQVVDPYGDGTFWAVSGTLEVVSGNITNPDVTVFPRVGGLPIARLFDVNLGDFRPGDRIDYRTTAIETMFTDYWFTLDYREPSAIVVDTPEARRLLENRERRRRIRDENEARRLHHF